jgi:hypothetical protein
MTVFKPGEIVATWGTFSSQTSKVNGRQGSGLWNSGTPHFKSRLSDAWMFISASFYSATFLWSHSRLNLSVMP